MASGQQIADENVLRFTTWVASRTDADFRTMATRGVLSRNDIASECGFAKSALSQNPRIREALKLLESSLREQGVLPSRISAEEVSALPPGARFADSPRAKQDAERLSRVEQENASLKAQVVELKQLLSRYVVLEEVLAETGRLPR